MTLTNEYAKETAWTTLSQLGGSGRLGVMIGATNFSYDKDGGLSFHFKMCRKANMIRINLNAWDTYDITFTKYNRKTYEVKEVKKFEGIYVEDLRRTIEEFTGLYLSL